MNKQAEVLERIRRERRKIQGTRPVWQFPEPVAKEPVPTTRLGNLNATEIAMRQAAVAAARMGQAVAA